MIEANKLEQALRDSHPDRWLRDNCGISKSEAKKEIERYKTEKRSARKGIVRKIILGGIAAVSLMTAGWINYSSHLSEKRAEREAAAEWEARKETSVENIIRGYGDVHAVANACGQGGNIYLIGQIHADRGFNEEGFSGNYLCDETGASSQKDNFRIMQGLARKRGLELVIGEGIPETGKTFQKDPRDAGMRRYFEAADSNVTNFFKENETITAYMALKRFFPGQFLLYGSNDEEYDKKIKEVFKQIGARSKIFGILEAGELAKVDPVSLKLMEESFVLDDERGIKYMREGIERADRLGEREIAIVFGQAHLPLMKEIYEQWTKNDPKARKMSVIVTKSANFPKPNYEKPYIRDMFMEFYNFKE